MASTEPPAPAEDNGGCYTETEEETIAFQKKRSRRVSFAETTAIHLFIRDEEYETPPDAAGNSTPAAGGSSGEGGRLSRTESDEIMELLQSDDDDDDQFDGDGAADDDDLGAVKRSFLRPMESPSPASAFGSATSNDEDNFFGPVSMDFIKPGRLSDSAASDENHDITMDSTAFSMHFRSLARSDSGADFKTPTGTRTRLAFDERTAGQTSTANSLGDLMVLTAGRKPVSHSSVSADKVYDSAHSDDMSLVSENPHRYDYGKLPPELDVLLAEGGEDVGAGRLSGHVSSLKKDTVYASGQKRQEPLNVAHNSGADISRVNGVEMTPVESISTADMNFHKRIDGVTLAPISLGESPRSKSVNSDEDPLTVLPIVIDDQVKAPVLQTNVTPFDKDEKATKVLTEANGKFESPSSRTQSNLNHEQPARSFDAGSVSSLLAKQRKIFKVNSSNDEWNLTPAKEIYDKGSSKHVWSTSRFAKSVSRIKRLEAFPFASTSKAEGTASRLLPPRHPRTPIAKNNMLGYSTSSDISINHVNAPVVRLEGRFSDVAKDNGELKKKMDNNDLRSVGNKEHAKGTLGVKVVRSTCLPSPERTRKLVTAVNSPSLTGSHKKGLDHHMSKDYHAKTAQQSIESDPVLPEITFNEHNSATGMSDDAVFSSDSGLKSQLPTSSHQENLSISLVQQGQSPFRVDRDGEQEAGVLPSRTEHSTLLSSGTGKTNVVSSGFEYTKLGGQESQLQNENSMISSQSGLVTSTCFQTVVDKVSDSRELYSLSDDGQTGKTLTSIAQEARCVKSIAGFNEGFDRPNEFPIQVWKSPEADLAFSMLREKSYDVENDASLHLVGDVPTPRLNQLTSKYDKDDKVSKKGTYVCGTESSSIRKRKHGDLVDEAEHRNDEILPLQRKLQLHKDHIQSEEGSEVSCSVRVDAKIRCWDDVFTSFCGATKQLLSPLIDKHDLALIEKLDDILVHLEKVKSYEHFYHNTSSQKTFDLAKYLQNKRLADMKLLLYRTVYKKAKLQLLHLKRETLSDQVQQLKSRVQESETLMSSSLSSGLHGQKSIHVDCVQPESCPADIEDRSSAPVEISPLRKELEVSDRKIENLKESFRAYFKVVEEPTCTKITEYATDFLKKRVSRRSLLSELQLWEIESLKTKDGQQNFLFNHHDFLSQRLSVNLSSKSAMSISKELNNLKISKMFQNMDACTAFSFVFGSETILTDAGLRTISREAQKTNSVLHNLLDVVEEVELAMMELRNLTHSRFSQPSARQLDLQLCFSDFKSGARVNLRIDVTCLNRGVYPSEAMPHEVQGRAAGNEDKLQLLLGNIRNDLKGLRYGYMRIIRLCRCVSKTMQAGNVMT